MMGLKILFLLWMSMGLSCTTGRKQRLCKEAGEILDNGSFTSMNERKRKYVCRSDFVSNIPDLEKLTFKCKFERKSDSYEWKAKLTRVDTIYLRNVTCERMSTDVNGNMSIDEKLAGNNGYKEYIGDREFTLIELDMIVDKSNKRPSRPERYRATFDKDETKRWQIDVPCEISDGIGDLQELEIRRAISIWEQYSCLHFFYNPQVYNRLVFQLGEDNFCGSEVGMKQGPQIIYLGKNCFELEIIVHEIGHALGFYHEHNRWDRDNYIKIHFENINPGYNESFIKREPENADFDHDYDYLSIMHYGQYFFSKNASAKLITIETTNPNFQSRIGKVKLPSFQDYKTLNDMYKCKDVCAKVECPEGGFLGKHCQCYCKGNPDGSPVRLCFQREECPKPFVNKYLFDVMNKDNTSLINMTRASFPDKTILNLFPTNWNCTIASQLRCEEGKWTQTNAECPVALDIKMIDETDGVVEVILNDVHRGYICDDDWDDNDATVACKMLGYTKGWAYFEKPQEVNESLPILLDNVQCRGEELSLADCKHNGWGNHDCEYSEVVSVKCFNDSYTNYIDKTHCGKIQLNDSKRKKRHFKITGGFETMMGMHPWQVEIQRKKRGWIHWCGGTIINNEWILSAAHCFNDLIGKYDGLNAKLYFKDVRVIVGDHDLNKNDEYEEMFHIEYIVKHWNYSEFERKYSNNDIALLKIKSTSGISFNDYIQPACLPEEFTQLLSEPKCEVSGWGTEGELGTKTDTLRAAEVMIIPEKDCHRYYNKYPINFKKVICAGDESADTCQGDSGGPLICEINGQSTVIGITSWGKGCSQHEAPGVYTKVSEYVRWINYQISNHRLEEDPCKVPLHFDKHLSISDRTHASLSGGSIVKVWDIVYFNCSTTDNDIQEPVNRRFICINGQWIENDKDESWTFGNNGTFPKCRKANCEPNCENGGICSKDDYCRCKHLTSGKRCEKVICDDKCFANNGECVGPGKCKCPEGKFGANCEQPKCAKPKEVQHAVLREKYANKEKFEEGDKVEYDCELGYTIEGTTRERWCRNTNWTEVRFTCNPILCPTLPQIQHGSIFQDTSDGLANNYESVAEYTCDRDYYLNGNTQLKTVRRTCQSDGKWSGNEPICEVPKCNLLDDFYGGSVEYFGRRDLYSQAFYSCDENYSMIPSNVQHSTCENNLRWEPPPPKCFKKADRYVPNDGYLRGWKRGKVSHGESYKICCDKDFEVERDNNVPVNKEECTNIRNNNGTLEPSVACVEELCETDDRQTEYKHEDGSEFMSRIRSNEMVWMQCKKGYAFYDNRHQPLPSPQKRRCVRGKIQDAPTCIEAKSSLVGYPYRQSTLYRDSKRNILDRNKYIEPNERIEVFCSDGYELYVEFNKVYLDEYFTTSKYGEFDKEKNKFPVCLEKRCYLNDLENAEAEYENKTHVDFSTKIRSGTYIILSCRRGFAAYDENGQAIETSQKSQCIKGTIVDAPKCQEAKCSLVKYPRNLDTSYYNLNLNAPVEDITGYIESSHTINVYCKKASQYELYVEASNQYITNFGTRCKQGSFKKGKHKFPVCVKRRCVFEPSKVPRACFVIDDGRNCKSDKFKIHSESSMKIKCVKGYTLFVSGKEVKDQGKITCVKGSYPDFNCTANGCTAPEVNNTELLSETVFKHKEKVTYKCKEGYWFSKSKLEKQEVLSFESKCHLGNWTTHIPESCEPVACYLNVLAGNEYSIYGTENVIVNDSFQDNGTSIGVRCKDGFDLYDDADTLIKNTTFVPEVTCHVGKWSNIHWCKKRCNIPTRLNIQFSKDGENLTMNDKIKHMESVNTICTGEKRNSSSFIKCVNGILDPYDDCTSENYSKLHISTSTLSTASTNYLNTQQQNENEAPDDNLTEMEDNSDVIEDHSNSSEGCKLSDDERYTYWNANGDEIKPGDNIVTGDILTVKCRFFDMYSYIVYDYDYNETDTTADDITIDDDMSISCKNDHTMTKIQNECPKATKDKSCLQIDNGNVIISNSYYVVSCDKGFSLDIFEPEEKRSNCIDGKLKSVIGGQEPECIPDRCKVPYDYDTLLSISDRSHVSLSGGSVVAVGDYVYFNCSKTGNDMHEPVNRRFKCINGQWIEDERDKSWQFGNNGTFPKCRKTMCEPECENGGVCVRDGECKCKHFTSGKHCENVLCDDKCKDNNGECVGPGKCRCPEGKFGTNCEHSSCRLPEIENMANLNTPRTYYAIGETVGDFTCSRGHFLSSDKGMTCQNNGTWSDVITCVKGIHYLIRAKTGTRPGAGTDANVFITLSGSGGSTRRINFGGEFESGDVDEIREFAKDIRPIHNVHIGHDGGSWRDILPAWDLEYISIYVEHMEEFYVFRNNRKQWVEKDNALTLNREGNKTCINSFDDGHVWYLHWGSVKYIKFGRGEKMSLRTCKQACVSWKDTKTQKQCVSVYYNHSHKACSGFTFVNRFFSIDSKNWLGRVYLRTCKNDDLVIRKQIDKF